MVCFIVTHISEFFFFRFTRSSPWPTVAPPDDCTELPIASNCVQWFGIMMTRPRGKRVSTYESFVTTPRKIIHFLSFSSSWPLKTNPLISIVILNINHRLFYQNSVFIFFSLSLLSAIILYFVLFTRKKQKPREKERESSQKPRCFSNQNRLLIRQRRARIRRFRRGLSIWPADFILVIRS